jgi:hypothetical protein
VLFEAREVRIGSHCPGTLISGMKEEKKYLEARLKYSTHSHFDLGKVRNEEHAPAARSLSQQKHRITEKGQAKQQELRDIPTAASIPSVPFICFSLDVRGIRS